MPHLNGFMMKAFGMKNHRKAIMCWALQGVNLCILYANCEKDNPRKVAAESKHLKEKELSALHNLITKHEFLFDGTLGTWKTKAVDIELQLDSKPYHAKPYLVPRPH